MVSAGMWRLVLCSRLDRFGDGDEAAKCATVTRVKPSGRGSDECGSMARVEAGADKVRVCLGIWQQDQCVQPGKGGVIRIIGGIST